MMGWLCAKHRHVIPTLLLSFVYTFLAKVWHWEFWLVQKPKTAAQAYLKTRLACAIAQAKYVVVDSLCHGRLTLTLAFLLFEHFLSNAMAIGDGLSFVICVGDIVDRKTI